MRKAVVVTAVLALLCLGSLAQAVTIDTLTVGNAGNAADSRVMDDGTTGYGSVGYNYNIGKYEVTAAQYTDFLNKVARTDTYGLYSTNMDTAVYWAGCNIKRAGTSGDYSYSVTSDWANRPVNCVSFWDACRFANWLHNGQPTGAQTASTTERGAYTLDGYTGQDGRSIGRNAGATWAVTSEDEWYKAAYYKSGSTNAGYWDYPMHSDISTTPSNDITDPDGGNNANFGQGSFSDMTRYTIGDPYYRTNVGEFENSASASGTFDQGGNVMEWNEAIVYQGPDYATRGLRGGSFFYSDYYLQASSRDQNWGPADEDGIVGFRIAAVPEPSSLLALLCGVGGLGGMTRLRYRK
jgi:sulfatase modifying factor 1